MERKPHVCGCVCMIEGKVVGGSALGANGKKWTIHIKLRTGKIERQGRLNDSLLPLHVEIL